MSGNLSCRLISTANLRNQRHSSTIARRASIAKADWAKKRIVGRRNMAQVCTNWLKRLHPIRSFVSAWKKVTGALGKKQPRTFILFKQITFDVKKQRTISDEIRLWERDDASSTDDAPVVRANKGCGVFLHGTRAERRDVCPVTAVNKNTFRMQRSMNHSTLIDWSRLTYKANSNFVSIANSYTCLVGISHQLWITPRAPQRKTLDFAKATQGNTHTHTYYNTTQCIVLPPKTRILWSPLGAISQNATTKMPPPNPTHPNGRGIQPMQHNVTATLYSATTDGTVRWSCENRFLGRFGANVWSADGDSIGDEDYPLEGRRPMKSDGFASKIAAHDNVGD